ncbi:hypothetical protein OHT93_36455 [Streptomyces sp. NBC_00191]|uniref:hypothetical protein n=1 Tax=Streptomyces sp. NBC_00191 TaxID=2975674 RepID=UPI003255164A
MKCSTEKSVGVILLLVVSLLFMGVPQAAADSGSKPLLFSPEANAPTRAVAAADPAAAAAAANVCGAGYTLYYAERLPDERRFGTLFIYTKPGAAENQPVCAIFDNNTGVAKYMKIKLCSNWIADGCTQDSGTFSQYAGPVYQKRGGCGKVTAIMTNSASSSTALIDAVRSTTAC